ncbi:hypothetical protein [Asaia platycodi]|uniref:hypothetical protein n=1 Tax=Asaia platycodi TaxID=610243 RepID=UPI000470E156|nr:hypothetical protein [Asaia platycodi]
MRKARALFALAAISSLGLSGCGSYDGYGGGYYAIQEDGDAKAGMAVILSDRIIPVAAGAVAPAIASVMTTGAAIAASVTAMTVAIMAVIVTTAEERVPPDPVTTTH